MQFTNPCSQYNIAEHSSMMLSFSRRIAIMAVFWYKASANETIQDTFETCAILKGATIPVMTKPFLGRSRVECAITCLKDETCTGVNVCIRRRSEVQCRMALNGTSPTFGKKCNKSEYSINSCAYLKRKLRTQIHRPSALSVAMETLPAEPAKLQVTSLRPLSIVYDHDELNRDCQEKLENTNTRPDSGLYQFKPINSKNVTVLLCNFTIAASTVVLRRSALLKIPVDIQSVQNGYLDSIDNFFIGLDALNILTQQTEYELQIQFQVGTQEAISYYTKLKISDSSESYAVSYEKFSYSGASIGILVYSSHQSTSQGLFSAEGFSTFTCAQQNGFPGWFNAGCQGISPFSPNLTWLINGTNMNVDRLEFRLGRPYGVFTD